VFLARADIEDSEVIERGKVIFTLAGRMNAEHVIGYFSNPKLVLGK